MKVSLVIPNYNTWYLVERNINSALHFDDNLINEIIVVDDCSPTENYINFSNKVKIIRNEQNLLYTKTVNIGLKHASGDIIMLLDSDAYFVMPLIEKIIQLFSNNKSLGCIGFKTVDESGNDTGNVLPEPSILSFIAGQQLHKLLRNYNIFQSKKLLPFSCAVVFRKNCLQEMNYLDEQFPYLEADHDISMRIHRSSHWQLQYVPELMVYHKGGSSIAKNYKRVLQFYESRWLLMKKHNKLGSAFIAKWLTYIRFSIETLVLQFQSLYKNVDDKIEGRKKLKQLIKNLK